MDGIHQHKNGDLGGEGRESLRTLHRGQGFLLPPAGGCIRGEIDKGLRTSYPLHPRGLVQMGQHRLAGVMENLGQLAGRQPNAT